MGWTVVPGGGVEPPRAEARRILSPLRLPVPPSRLVAETEEEISLIYPLSLCNWDRFQIKCKRTVAGSGFWIAKKQRPSVKKR